MAERSDRKSPAGADFVAKIVKDPKQPPDTVMLTGYVGASSEEGHTRLYFDPNLSSYVEIPNDAILHSQEVAAEQGGLAATHLWIKRDAELIYGPAGSQRPRGKFLEGPIMQGGAGGAAAAGGLHPTLLPPCPTPHVPCVTQHCTLPAQCLPTPHLPCPTLICTAPPQCLPTLHVPCPTHPPHCIPSVNLICPTPSAVGQCGQTAHGPCLTVPPVCPLPTGFACPSFGPCQTPSIACQQGQGGQQVQALAAAVPPTHVNCGPAITAIGCPTHAPFLCPVTPQCPPTPHLPCATHAPLLCPVTPHCPPTPHLPCPTHAPFLCPVTPHCPPTPFLPCATHAPMFCPVTPHCPPSPFCPTPAAICPTQNPAQCPLPSGFVCPPVTPACPVQTLACGGGNVGGGVNQAG